MRRLILSVLACCLLGATKMPPEPVRYTLSPEFDGGHMRALDVEIRFAGDTDGTTRLTWPEHWAGENKLAQWTRDLRVDGAISVHEGANGERIIRAAPRAPLTVRYRIVSAYDHDPTVDEWQQQSWPIIRPRWFYAAGEALFAAPNDRNDASATFEWRGAPAGFGFASDLEHLAGPRRQAVRPGTVNNIVESMLIGGYDLRVTGSADSGSGVRVATIGSYAFNPDALAPVALRVISAERGFWGTDAGAPFLVTMAPLKASKTRQSFSGTGRGDAFAMWVGQDIPLPMLTWLLGHEYFHTWNPAHLGGLPGGPGEPRQFWFSEGFTDFYARRLMVRAGLTSPQEFVDEWNEALLRYGTSPFRTTPNNLAAEKFWSDEDAQKLPYDRGSILAALWDYRLRATSGGRRTLDAVMHRQLSMVHKTSDESGPYAADYFVKLARAAGLDVQPDIARYVTRGALVMLPSGAFGPCARVRTERRPVFERGYDAEATTAAGNVVHGLRPDSPAFAAGLRNGMRILKRISGTYGNSTADYVMQVDDRGTERLIRFRPAGLQSIVVQQLTLDRVRAAREPKACAASLGGLGTGAR
jgi:predicted metalloprotease with PDZ domain